MGNLEQREALDSEHLDKGMRLAFGLALDREGESVLEAIQQVAGPTPMVVLANQGEEEDPVLRIPGEGEADRFEETARYQIVGEIARGGVGVVYQGKDRDLGRDVAIKVLREDRVGSPEVVQRFIEEAQIEGQLQHPGVVPVYGLGVQPDGRPYFAMKLVKGDTLASLLKARRKLEEKRGRFLQIFEQVCQTVAYAHARRVIHRDLKPANVLVGGVRPGAGRGLGLREGAPRGAASPTKRASLGMTEHEPDRDDPLVESTVRSRSPARSWERRPTCRPSRRTGTSAERGRDVRRLRPGRDPHGDPDRAAALRRQHRRAKSCARRSTVTRRRRAHVSSGAVPTRRS